ncbi:MAG: TetR family transcriptional regulator [Candidatus Lokiarchaeota archaeon]|nr:TetR family transcriptional regulator [Candidatus Lokiarchaeota archaeon]
MTEVTIGIRMTDRKRIRNKKKHRADIISSTKRLIEEYGYSNVTLRDIAEQSNLSVGLIYKNFPKGKSDLVKEIFSSSFWKIYKPENEDLEINSEIELIAFIKTTIDNFIKVHRQNAQLNEALEQAFYEDPDIQDIFNSFNESLLSNIPKLLSNLNEKHIINMNDIERKSNWILQLVDSFVHRHVIKGLVDASDEEVSDFLVDIVLKILSIS